MDLAGEEPESPRSRAGCERECDLALGWRRVVGRVRVGVGRVVVWLLLLLLLLLLLCAILVHPCRRLWAVPGVSCIFRVPFHFRSCLELRHGHVMAMSCHGLMFMSWSWAGAASA